MIEVQQLRGSELTDGSGSVVVPCRNPILLLIAANLAVSANAESVMFAANKDDEIGFPDCRMAFVQSLNNLLVTAEIPIEICAPFLDKSKWWIAGLAREMGS